VAQADVWRVTNYSVHLERGQAKEVTKEPVRLGDKACFPRRGKWLMHKLNTKLSYPRQTAMLSRTADSTEESPVAERRFEDPVARLAYCPASDRIGCRRVRVKGAK
jgi:hypothetical protein